MQETIKYTIFRTKWGWFGLAGTEDRLWRTCLPLSGPEEVKSHLLKNLTIMDRDSGIGHRVSRIRFDKNLFKMLQEQIIAYFEGVCVNFSRDIPVALDGFSMFSRSVLKVCRDLKFGEKITYSVLAKKLGRSSAVRAVGNALAKNPLPLIIPCHRVIHSDGKIGGFSAPGGEKIKEKLLNHELAGLICSKDCSD